MHRVVGVVNVLKQGGAAICSTNAQRAHSSLSPQALVRCYPDDVPKIAEICSRCKHGSPEEILSLKIRGDMCSLLGKDPREELAHVPSYADESFGRSFKYLLDAYEQSRRIARFKPHEHYPELSAYWQATEPDGRLLEISRGVEAPISGAKSFIQAKLKVIGYPEVIPGLAVPLILCNGHNEANGMAMHVPVDSVLECDPIRAYLKLAGLMEQFMHGLGFNERGACSVAELTVPRFGPEISRWCVASWEKGVLELLMSSDRQERELGQQMREEEGQMVEDMKKEIKKLEEEQEKPQLHGITCATEVMERGLQHQNQPPSEFARRLHLDGCD